MENGRLSDKPKILLVGSAKGRDDHLCQRLGEEYEVIEEKSPFRALARMARERFAGVYACGEHIADAFQIGKLLQNERILEGMPDGIVLLESDKSIIWGNGRLCEWSGRESVVGANFYEALGSPEILGPDFDPLTTTLSTGRSSTSTLRCNDNRYYQIHAAPIRDSKKEGEPHQHLVVTVRDVTVELLQQQKLVAIHRAGIELADLNPGEVAEMDIDQRIELLKSNILHYTRDLLDYNVVEIRLLEHATGRLTPLLAEGIMPEAASRDLRAELQKYGVTGFVANTGKSYLCENTEHDPLYLEGAQGACSSLTVPLMLQDKVIGTFNVESCEANAFSENDRLFLEVFARDVAVALNTLELLVAEKVSTIAENIEAIHAAVAMPVDVILNDAVNIMERYIGHEPEVADRLKRILRNARDIKEVIQKVGQQLAPSLASPQSFPQEKHPGLVGRRILVVDNDDTVRGAAHSLLERIGCIVETSNSGDEACFMVRNLGAETEYDVIIADIRLPDMSGYDLMIKLQETLESVPLVLMTGFGYDPGHSIVKARKAGLSSVLYKPFRIDQLLQAIESVITVQDAVNQS